MPKTNQSIVTEETTAKKKKKKKKKVASLHGEKRKLINCSIVSITIDMFTIEKTRGTHEQSKRVAVANIECAISQRVLIARTRISLYIPKKELVLIPTSQQQQQ